MVLYEYANIRFKRRQKTDMFVEFPKTADSNTGSKKYK